MSLVIGSKVRVIRESFWSFGEVGIIRNCLAYGSGEEFDDFFWEVELEKDGQRRRLLLRNSEVSPVSEEGTQWEVVK